MTILIALKEEAVNHNDGADTVYSPTFYFDDYFGRNVSHNNNLCMQLTAADANVTANFDIEITLDESNWVEVGITEDGVTNTTAIEIGGDLPPCLAFRLKAVTTAGGAASTLSALIAVP
jgi:hypothetical protein